MALAITFKATESRAESVQSLQQLALRLLVNHPLSADDRQQAAAMLLALAAKPKVLAALVRKRTGRPSDHKDTRVAVDFWCERNLKENGAVDRVAKAWCIEEKSVERMVRRAVRTNPTIFTDLEKNIEGKWRAPRELRSLSQSMRRRTK